MTRCMGRGGWPGQTEESTLETFFTIRKKATENSGGLESNHSEGFGKKEDSMGLESSVKKGDNRKESGKLGDISDG